MIGIDISDQSLKIVQLSNDTKPKLTASVAVDLPTTAVDKGIIQNPPEFGKYIQTVLKDKGFDTPHRDSVVASIPETQSFLRVIEIPHMREDEVSEAIQWEVARHIPFGLENVYIDWQAVSGEGHEAGAGRQEVQVGAAQRKVVDALYATLSSLKLDLAAFELESQAIVRALVSSNLRTQQGLLVVDLGAVATNVIIHDHGAMRFTATLGRGSDALARTLSKADQQTIQARPHELAEAEMDRLATQLMPGMEELVVEVRGIVEFYNGIDARHEVQEIILTGGGSNLPRLDRAFTKYFDNVHIQRGNPWVNILPPNADTKPPLGLKESVRFTTALGLALRPVIR